jgi:hypothetical protein
MCCRTPDGRQATKGIAPAIPRATQLTRLRLLDGKVLDGDALGAGWHWCSFQANKKREAARSGHTSRWKDRPSLRLLRGRSLGFYALFRRCVALLRNRRPIGRHARALRFGPAILTSSAHGLPMRLFKQPMVGRAVHYRHAPNGSHLTITLLPFGSGSGPTATHERGTVRGGHRHLAVRNPVE